MSAQETVKQYVINTNAVTLGSLIAVLASWSANHSVGWAILHGILSWFYLIYVLLGLHF